MKALVISDIHGAQENMVLLSKRMELEFKADVLIFCGDGFASAQAWRSHFSRWIAVPGNCDVAELLRMPMEKTEMLDKMYVLVSHGHLYHVKRSLNSLNLRAREAGALVACFGHTHQQFNTIQNDVLMLNPGALCNGCYALLDTSDPSFPRAKLLHL